MIFRERKNQKSKCIVQVGFEESGKKRKEKNTFCVGYLCPIFFSVSLFYANRVISRAYVEKIEKNPFRFSFEIVPPPLMTGGLGIRRDSHLTALLPFKKGEASLPGRIRLLSNK